MLLESHTRHGILLAKEFDLIGVSGSNWQCQAFALSLILKSASAHGVLSLGHEVGFLHKALEMIFLHKKRFISSSSFHFGNPKVDGAAHNLFGGSIPSSSGNGTASQSSVGMQCLATNRVWYSRQPPTKTFGPRCGQMFDTDD